MAFQEKEFEETMDHLQTDIDSLESEKGQLKEKLKSYGKKATQTVPGAEGVPGSLSDTSLPGVPTQDDQLLLNEIKALKEALRSEHQQKCKFLAEDMKKKLDSLSPLPLIDTKNVDPKLRELRKRRLDLIRVIQYKPIKKFI